VTSQATRDYLLDVSRLIWRVWDGRLATGIDRVCLEYVQHFGPRSQAVVQFRGRIFVLSPADSDHLFGLLAGGSGGVRRRLLAFAPIAWARARRSPPERGMIYLNVGHTGLHDPALPRWIDRHGIKAVYLVHDLIPITHPQFCRDGEAGKHVNRIEHALASGAGILANSNTTLDELAAFAADRRIGMPPGLAAWIAPRQPCRALPTALPERPYFLAVGTIEGRKNHLLLLTVWRELVGEMGVNAPMLIIIGQRGWQARPAEAILDDLGDLTGHVRELGRCTDAELAGWLKGARALLMPSFAEGFGLPVVEALARGTPVIASDLPVYREIAGDIPTYLLPEDRRGWKEAIRAFVGDGAERERQKLALQQYRAPDWPGHFARVEGWLETL
jgi:glycosyltransferase involved in cell wall biosynthesis